MGTQIFANNARSVLAAPIDPSDTSITLATGGGARFPSPSGGDFFLISLTQPTGVETSWETVRCTVRSGDTMTVVRAQEVSTAQSWPAGTLVEMRTTAGTLAAMQQSTPSLASQAGLGSTAGRMAYTTAPNVWAETPITGAGRALIDDADAAAMRSTLGLGDAATKSVGTGAGTVAAGDHGHSSYAAAGDVGVVQVARTRFIDHVSYAASAGVFAEFAAGLRVTITPRSMSHWLILEAYIPVTGGGTTNLWSFQFYDVTGGAVVNPSANATAYLAPVVTGHRGSHFDSNDQDCVVLRQLVPVPRTTATVYTVYARCEAAATFLINSSQGSTSWGIAAQSLVTATEIL